MKEVYVSTDVETDGPIPGPHSMLSMGSAAFMIETKNGIHEKKLVGTFSVNFHTLEGASGHPDTMKWWGENSAAYEATRADATHPYNAMLRYVKWLKSLPGKPVFVGYPAGFDFLFVYWYLIRFAEESPFSFSALDIKTFAMVLLKLPYREVSKRTMRKEWFSNAPHTHIALDDAIEQGELFCNMLIESAADEIDRLRAEVVSMRRIVDAAVRWNEFVPKTIDQDDAEESELVLAVRAYTHGATVDA